MVRTERGPTGFVSVAASAAMILTAAVMAQNASAGPWVSGLAAPAKPSLTKPEARQASQQAMPSSDCGGKLAHFLKELTSPPNPFGYACDPRDDW